MGLMPSQQRHSLPPSPDLGAVAQHRAKRADDITATHVASLDTITKFGVSTTPCQAFVPRDP